MWDVFFPFEFLQRNCYCSKPRRNCFSFVPRQPWRSSRLKDWKSKCKKRIFSHLLLAFWPFQRRKAKSRVETPERGAVQGTEVNKRELNLKSQLLSEQSHIWDREISARWIAVTALSPFSCILGLSQPSKCQCTPCLQQVPISTPAGTRGCFFPSLVELTCTCPSQILEACAAQSLFFPSWYPRVCFSLLISALAVVLQDVTTAPAQARGSHLGLGHRDVNPNLFPCLLQCRFWAEYTKQGDATHLGSISLTLSFHTTMKQALGMFS